MTNSVTGSITGPIAARGYRSYLVRFWQSTEQGAWHASAQCVQTGNTVRFGDVVSLLAFLQLEVTGKPPADATGVRTEVGNFQEEL
jgi:hypothetical protein